MVEARGGRWGNGRWSKGGGGDGVVVEVEVEVEYVKPGCSSALHPHLGQIGATARRR